MQLSSQKISWVIIKSDWYISWSQWSRLQRSVFLTETRICTGRWPIHRRLSGSYSLEGYKEKSEKDLQGPDGARVELFQV
jgi:hypothetical protein